MGANLWKTHQHPLHMKGWYSCMETHISISNISTLKKAKIVKGTICSIHSHKLVFETASNLYPLVSENTLTAVKTHRGPWLVSWSSIPPPPVSYPLPCSNELPEVCCEKASWDTLRYEQSNCCGSQHHYPPAIKLNHTSALTWSLHQFPNLQKDEKHGDFGMYLIGQYILDPRKFSISICTCKQNYWDPKITKKVKEQELTGL